jgi:hypothetical protein
MNFDQNVLYRGLKGGAPHVSHTRKGSIGRVGCDAHIPMAGEAKVVKLTGRTSSKNEGVRESRSPRV